MENGWVHNEPTHLEKLNIIYFLLPNDHSPTQGFQAHHSSLNGFFSIEPVVLMAIPNTISSTVLNNISVF
ncbi:hypothetical protein [Paenibacillus terrae]|uniref:Uncharacterized protein n=1 Tax=Paenibacillus terrae TaxID=159743 RepID=A0A0D7WT16_9BACL|nr:hypothetical protein [Paenibacillus terrae]KJD42311.1 hypothetical protein QD47_29015 [Paenibacillus terrae]